ncbi:MAG: thioesterase [Firmicutes bacterium ML8_F2]|nr:MAG: thioesterase [Firmicutes bacterium ML8_F2]
MIAVTINQIQNDVHANCLLCGSKNSLSLGLCFSPGDDGDIKAIFQAHSGLQGYQGILHGGVVSSLLDSAMTHCLFYQGIEAVTGDLHVRFVKSVPCDARMELRARLLKASPPLYRLRGELVIDGQTMAWAEAKFMKRL